MAYLAYLAPSSRRPQRHALETVARFLTRGKKGYRDYQWESLTYHQMVQVQTWLATNHKPGTARRMMAAVRRVLKECYRLELITRDQYERATDLDPIRGSSEPPGRALEEAEVQELMAVAGTNSIGIRNQAIVALLFGCGLRSVEISRLLLRDLEKGDGEILVRGKGRKQRRVPVPIGALPYLNAWLEERGNRHGPLFCSSQSLRKMALCQISPDVAYQVVTDLARKAGIEKATPHDLRRTFITILLDRGADALVVSKLAGHQSVNTTVVYDRRSKAGGREAVGLLGWPKSGY